MVSAGLILPLIWAAAPDVDATPAVRAALTRGQYPWYDARADAVKVVAPPKPITAPPASSSNQSFSLPGVGEVVTFVVLALLLAALLALLAWAWARYGPDPEDLARTTRRVGHADRTRDLPVGLPSVDLNDPWSEAVRRRERGDHAGAILCVFVYMLLTLDRLGQIRLAPGRTARQLVRAVESATVRRQVEPVLRLFEATYYGHQAPSAEAFEAAWTQAVSFRKGVDTGEATS